MSADPHAPRLALRGHDVPDVYAEIRQAVLEAQAAATHSRRRRVVSVRLVVGRDGLVLDRCRLRVLLDERGLGGAR